MDSARLDRIESQISTDDEQKQSYFPTNLINKGVSSSFRRRDGEIEAAPPTSDSGTKHMLKLLDLYKHPGISISMSSDISSAMRAGDKAFLQKMKSDETPMACFKDYKGDTILHIAAAFGHLELVKSIVSECPCLMFEPNWKDQLPFHIAARAGHLDVTKALMDSVTFFSDSERLNPYVLKDEDGNTPLHLASKELHCKSKIMHRVSNSDESRHMKTAEYLVSANQHVSFLANNDETSSLYLAVESGNFKLVDAMLNILDNNLATQLKGRKTLVHAALKAKNIDVLDIILAKFPDFVNERDEEGRTCLSVGASVGFYEGICKLFDTSTSSIFVCDDDGSFPIHIAVENGHTNVVKEILKRCPNSVEQLNKERQNIIHIAAKSGKCATSSEYIQRIIDTKSHLLEEQDVDGNTPVHIATMNWRPKALQVLTRNNSTTTKILETKNSDGLRPLDIAEINLQSNYVFRERMTMMVLLRLYNQRQDGVSMVLTSGMTLRRRSEKLGGGVEKYKDRVNILLLVATLITTITFTACITMPGGFKSSTPNPGTTLLLGKIDLQLFIFCDTIALFTSVIAIVALIWAQLGDEELTQKAFNLALPALFMSIFFMSSAFFFAVWATSYPDTTISNTITIVGCILLMLITSILAPYLIPQVYGVPFIETITGLYLFFLLNFVNEDDNGKENTTQLL